MKLVSVNAVLIASVNVSLYFNTFIEDRSFPTVTLFVLSLVYIALVILLEYEHRQFKQTEINIIQSSVLLKRYLFLFILGLALTLAQKFQVLSGEAHPNLKNYTLLSNSIHYSMLYYTANTVLGVTYLFLFLKEYKKANRCRIQWEIVNNVGSIGTEFCSICLLNIEQGHKVAKIDCLHNFHALCLNKWVKQKTECPLCKAPIPLLY